MLEESDEDEEKENFELYVSDDKKINKTSSDDDKNLDSIPFTREELCEPPKLPITEKALIHDLPKYDRIQTRSQTRNKNIHQETSLDKLQEYDKITDKIEEMEDRNNPPDKESDIEDKRSIAKIFILGTMKIRCHK